MMPERDPASVVVVSLGAAMDSFTAEVSDLTKAVRSQTRAWRLALFLLFVSAGQTLWLLQLTRGNHKTAVDNRHTLLIVRDATTPGGKLYTEGQARTGEAVKRILVCDRAYLDSATKGTPIPAECP